VALVHGDDEARQALARLMEQTGVEAILPRASDVLDVGAPRKAHASISDRRPVSILGNDRPLNASALKELHGHLVQARPPASFLLPILFTTLRLQTGIPSKG